MYPDSLKNEPTRRTPWIILESGKIFIMGRSIPENAGNLYRPVHEWISDYVRNYSGESTITFGFEYINTSSTKWIFAILKELSVMKNLNENARIIWYYEQGDEDMSELGFILRSLVDCPFLVVEMSEMNLPRYKKILSGSI
ncbi:MAG: DUF1987 domain-containing protein [Bacteroidales bacterium]|nr:DUF1987 domain-containing protein [Bacteroidales bacterium]